MMNVEKLPIDIKKKRTKKFTEKRNPYKTYLSAKWTWTEVFNEVDNLKDKNKNYLKDISIKYGIKYDTLAHKYNNYCKNKCLDFNKESRGGSNKIFTTQEEKDMYDYIKINFIDKNKPLNNNIIKEIALNKFKNKNKDKDKITFNASNGWCSMFKKKWNLSTQKVKCSRIATNVPTNDEINLFLDECEILRKQVKKKFFSTMMKQVIIL